MRVVQKLGGALLRALLVGATIGAAAPASAQMGPGDMAGVTPGTTLGGVVTQWTMIADRLGRGNVNWRTQAVMHIAMHDALNAAEPRYARWAPPAAAEPPAAGAAPLVAMAAAAYQVLLARHPEHAPAEADPVFRAALAAAPSGDAADAGIRLGAAIGLAVAARYAASAGLPQQFPQGTAPGRWRPTPPLFQTGLVAPARPFTMESAAEVKGPPPPPLGSPRYIAEVEEVRRLGGRISQQRTAEQREATFFWASQSSQRGFVHLAVALMAARPLPGGAWDEARAMSQLTAALADAYMVSWEEKRYFAFWRPVTAINEGSEGVPADPGWEALLPTPPHPDYPSGHSADCSTGARVLERIFGADLGPIEYPAVGTDPPVMRRFASLAAAATECGDSRIWAGAHFRAASEEGLRLGAAIAGRAVASVPPLPR